MNADHQLSIPRHVMARQVGDETVILDLNKGTYFGLDPVGARIWQLLTEGHSQAEICTMMVAEFDVSLDVLEGDLERLLDELKGRGLLASLT